MRMTSETRSIGNLEESLLSEVWY